MSNDEPSIDLDEFTTEYLLLRALKRELDRLTSEYELRKAEFVARVGDAHVARIAGQEVFTNRPINSFKGKQFAEDHPILAKTYTEIVEKPVLDTKGLARDHPALYAQYQSRQFRIVNVE